METRPADFVLDRPNFFSKTPADFLGRKIGRDHSSKLPADFAAQNAPNNQAKNSAEFLAKKFLGRKVRPLCEALATKNWPKNWPRNRPDSDGGYNKPSEMHFFFFPATQRTLSSVLESGQCDASQLPSPLCKQPEPLATLQNRRGLPWKAQRSPS